MGYLKLLIIFGLLLNCFSCGGKIPYKDFINAKRKVIQYGVPGGPGVNKFVHSLNCPTGLVLINGFCRRVFYQTNAHHQMKDKNMAPSVIFGLFALLLASACTAYELKDTSGQVVLKYEPSNDGLTVDLFRDGQSRISGTIGKGINFEKLSCNGVFPCKFSNENEHLSIVPVQNGVNVSWTSTNLGKTFEDCYNLNTSSSHWYGGPEKAYQVWPLEKMSLSGNDPYVITEKDYSAVGERYWLNSKGAYIWVDDISPLWIDQNQKHYGQVCFKSEAKAPYINRWRVTLTYMLVTLSDAKTAHLNAINTYLGKPTRHPNEKMITEPIWTTWAKYKQNINDATVLSFANDIRNHGYQGGQLEIDDSWETCYGSEEFTTYKFKDIANTVKKLHNNHWRVTLWIHPFVNQDCAVVANVGNQKGYFVRNKAGQTSASWWDGNNAHQIDYTNSEAVQWWSNRLRKLQQSPGIDSFKFDAGEYNYVNQPAVYHDVEHTPNILTQKYVEACTKFGDLIEVRASFRGQQYGEFVRMLDKSSNWGLGNGLATLITTLLQFNMNGYGMVLPDMVGGNGYGDKPTAELIVRWTQANTFMPAMQFSYLPWDYKNQVNYDIVGIVKKYIELHAKYAPNIISAMQKSIKDGTPVNAPIWWVDPTDTTALGVSDEYLLGENILVAPVIVQGAKSRDVYLPRGQWKDGNNGNIHTGPTMLKNYNAPIDVLPYFIKQ